LRKELLGKSNRPQEKQIELGPPLSQRHCLDASGPTGVYYDEGGHPMLVSALVRDPKFQDRIVAETRALLATVPA
jgi:galactose-1-phosphate uridylyltransferase